MSKFVQSVAIEPLQFEGDTITATVRPLKRGLYVQVLPILRELNAVKEELEASLGREPTKEEVGADPRIIPHLTRVLELIVPDLKGYLVDFKGPKDAAGAEIPLETVLEAAYFMPVALHLAMGLVATANVKEDEAGKAGRPSDA